jgi:hypothetical protein
LFFFWSELPSRVEFIQTLLLLDPQSAIALVGKPDFSKLQISTHLSEVCLKAIINLARQITMIPGFFKYLCRSLSEA